MIATIMTLLKLFRLARQGLAWCRTSAFIAIVVWAMSHSLLSCSTVRTDLLTPTLRQNDSDTEHKLDRHPGLQPDGTL